MINKEIIIEQTKKWINDVVIGCNFCPFAAKEVKRGSIHYEILATTNLKEILEKISFAFLYLNENPEVETTLLILPEGFSSFNSYLNLFDYAESLLKKDGYEGIYQVAGFHPNYVFAGSTDDDPANFTNRSPYSMLQLLREASISKATDNFPGIKNIPKKNIAYATKMGLNYMQLLKDSCINLNDP